MRHRVNEYQVLLGVPHRSINQTSHKYSIILNTYMFTSATLSVCMLISFVTTTARWTRLVVMYNRCLRRLNIQWISCIIRIFFFRHTVNIVLSKIVQKMMFYSKTLCMYFCFTQTENLANVPECYIVFWKLQWWMLVWTLRNFTILALIFYFHLRNIIFWHDYNFVFLFLRTYKTFITVRLQQYAK